MEFSELKIKKMLSKGEFVRVVAFGASNTQRYMPGMHWFDCVEMGFKNRFGGGCGHFIGSGVSGHTTVNLLNRFERDLAVYKPDLVIMTIGGNDCNPVQNIDETTFRKNLGELCSRIQDLGGDVVLQTYYACDLENIAEPGRAELMVRYMQIVREFAIDNGIALNDNDLRWAKLRDADVETYRLLMLNSMHVNEIGNQVIGLDLLRKFDIGLKKEYRNQFAAALIAQALLDKYSE